MQLIKTAETFIVLLQITELVNCESLLTPKPSNNEWIPTDISIAYLNWISELQTKTLTTQSTQRRNISTSTVSTSQLGKHVFRSSNESDLLARYHETERLHRGGEKGVAAPYNTPQLATTTSTSIPEDYISHRILNSSTVSGKVADKPPIYGRASAGVIGLLTVLISSMTIGGNVLVLAAFYVERTLRMPTNYFIASLAVTDVLIGIFSMNLYSLYLLLGYWPLGRLLCDLWLGLDHTLCLTSQYTVFFITLDRFCSVKIPARYRNWRTGNKVLIMIAITWILPSSIFFTTILGWPYFSASNHVRKSGLCYAEFSSNPMFNTILTIAYFWVTITVMTGLYIGIYSVALRLQKKSEAKRAKVRSLVKPSNGKAAHVDTAGSKSDDSKMELGESCNLESSNGTAVPANNQGSASAINNQTISKRPKGISINHTPDALASNMPTYCGSPQPNRPLKITNPAMTNNNNDLSSNPAIFHADDYSSFKLSPISIVDNFFTDIFSPHLSDPEIVDSMKLHDNRLYSFPSSPAVHVFSDSKLSNNSSSNGSSLKLSIAYSSQQKDRSSISIAPFEFDRKPSSTDVLDNLETFISQRCTRGSHGDRNCAANLNTHNMDGSLTCSFLETDSPTSKMTSLPISANSVNAVSQTGHNSLAKQDKIPTHPLTTQENHIELTPDGSKVSTSDSHVTATSRRTPLGFEKSHLRRNILFCFSSVTTATTTMTTMTGLDVEPAVLIERGRTENRARKALKTISFILGAFVLCWIPYHIVILIKGFCDNPQITYTCVNHHLYCITYWMCYLNSPINPFCYALANAQFKQAFLRILRLDLKRR